MLTVLPFECLFWSRAYAKLGAMEGKLFHVSAWGKGRKGRGPRPGGGGGGQLRLIHM